jgi:cell wall-associated NlpC family hydrolase
VLLASAALVLPTAPAAHAAPYEPPTPAATAPATPATPAAAGAATVTPDPLPQLLTRLKTLYQQAESATEAYDRAKEAAGKQRAKARAADARLAAQRARVTAARDQVGLLARQLYRTGGLSPYVAILNGEDPQAFFGGLHMAQQSVGYQKAAVDTLAAEQDRLATLNAKAQRALDAAQVAQDRQKKQKTQVQTGLRQVEKLLAGLSGVQADQLEALEEQGADKAQQEFLDSRALGGGPGALRRAPSKGGDRAIRYAFAQLGKPYVWGAQGPDAFDCSGLTSQAWAHAGVAIPRTSQEQWAALPRVPLSLLRPGDLVVYFPKATHVALYIGKGLVVQAPHTGSVVKVSPIAANPVLGAVRPDMGAQPLAHYKPRKVPARATAAARPGSG